MKVGDTVAVTIGGHTVANAKVSEINDNQAVLIVPATKVIMGIRTELEVPAPVESTTEHQILGVEQREQSAPVDAPASNVEPVEQPSVSEVTNSENVESTPAPATPPATPGAPADVPSVPDAATGVESA